MSLHFKKPAFSLLVLSVSAVAFAPFSVRAQTPAQPPALPDSARPVPKPLAANISIPVTVGGFSHTDWKNFNHDVGNRYINDVTVRRARIDLSGSITPYAIFRLVPDLAGSRVQLLDAYTELSYSPALRLRVGKFKAPTSLERSQATTANIFVEQGATLAIAPNYDIGVQLGGDVASGVLTYVGGVFDGTPDGGSIDSDADDSKDIAGRIQISPFAKIKESPFAKLLIGVGGSHGHRSGSTATPQVATYRSAGQATIFSYRSNVFASGDLNRVSAFVADHTGPFSIFGEWIRSRQDLTATLTSTTTATGRATAQAYQTYATFVLTGDATSFRGVAPKRPFDLRKRNWGAVELVARYDKLKFDDAAVSSAFSDPARSVDEASSWTGGVNWYLSRQLRLAVNYQVTDFVYGAITGNRPQERALLARLQTTF
jgi:phosphate-selective porin OprO/OprP